MEYLKTNSVASYAPEANSESIQYPFRRPQESFFTDGQEVTLLPGSYNEFVAAADERLAQAGLPLIKDRIPVIAYGANSNPYKLQAKMSAFGEGSDPAIAAELQMVPTVMATIPDAAIAWHGKPSQSGDVFAELYKGPETLGAEAPSHVSYLTPLQLALLHASEGVTYHLSEVDALVSDDRQPIEAYAYVAGNSCVLLKDGAPVLVARREEARLPNSMTADEAVDYMVGDARLPLQLALKSTNLAGKKALQTEVQAKLQAKGKSKEFSFPTRHSGFYGRAALSAFNNHTGVYQLAEQTLAALRPADHSLWQNRKTDIVYEIRRRAHNELADFLASQPSK